MSNKFKIEIIEAPMNNQTKLTAVEWLIQELQKRDMDVLISDLYIQAKEMEYKQMIEFGAKCIQSHNTTYGGNK